MACTGAVPITHVSLLPPPRCIEMIGSLLFVPVRVRPPGITTQESPETAA